MTIICCPMCKDIITQAKNRRVYNVLFYEVPAPMVAFACAEADAPILTVADDREVVVSEIE